MSDEEFDVEEAEPPTDAELSTVAELARQLIFLDDEIAKDEAAITIKKNDRKRLAEGTLPTALNHIGMTEFKLSNGYAVEIVTTLHPSIKDKVKAFKWLEDNNHGDIIREKVSVNFGKGQSKLVDKLKAFIKKTLSKQKTKITRDVHAGTLKAFVREQTAKGVKFPEEAFNIFELTQAVIIDPSNPAGGHPVQSKEDDLDE